MTIKKTETPLRVGVISYINAYPLFYALQSAIIPNPYIFYTGTPTEINTMLQEGTVDIALISSASFIDHRFSYIMFSDYGIGVKDTIISVCLFCKNSHFDFKTAPHFLVPSHSATSTRLLKVLCRHHWNLDATFHVTDLPVDALFAQELPFLLIGDQCLKKIPYKGSTADLAAEWHTATGLSFVFALIATRNEAFIHSQEAVLDFHKKIIESYEWAKKNEQELVRICEKKLSIPATLVEKYFKTIEYELDQDHIHGLDYFASLEV